MRREFYEANVRPDGTASYLELNPERPKLSSRGRGWDGVVVERDHFVPFDNGDVVYDEHFIGFVLGHEIHLASSLGGRRHEGFYSDGELFVSPGGQPVHWRLDDETDSLVVAVMPSTL